MNEFNILKWKVHVAMDFSTLPHFWTNFNSQPLVNKPSKNVSPATRRWQILLVRVITGLDFEITRLPFTNMFPMFFLLPCMTWMDTFFLTYWPDSVLSSTNEFTSWFKKEWKIEQLWRLVNSNEGGDFCKL